LVSAEDKEEALDHKAVLRIKELKKLQEMERDKIYSVIDAYIRDAKTRQAYGVHR
jgi:hypothetical protein